MDAFSSALDANFTFMVKPASSGKRLKRFILNVRLVIVNVKQLLWVRAAPPEAIAMVLRSCLEHIFTAVMSHLPREILFKKKKKNATASFSAPPSGQRLILWLCFLTQKVPPWLESLGFHLIWEIQTYTPTPPFQEVQCCSLTWLHHV